MGSPRCLVDLFGGRPRCPRHPCRQAQRARPAPRSRRAASNMLARLRWHMIRHQQCYTVSYLCSRQQHRPTHHTPHTPYHTLPHTPYHTTYPISHPTSYPISHHIPHITPHTQYHTTYPISHPTFPYCTPSMPFITTTHAPTCSRYPFLVTHHDHTRTHMFMLPFLSDSSRPHTHTHVHATLS